MDGTDLGTIFPFYDELVLKHDEITFTFFIFHEGLKPCTKGVKQVPGTKLNLLRREEPYPPQTRDDT